MLDVRQVLPPFCSPKTKGYKVKLIVLSEHPKVKSGRQTTFFCVVSWVPFYGVSGAVEKVPS